jgi:Flp pilus assembly protein TadD
VARGLLARARLNLGHLPDALEAAGAAVAAAPVEEWPHRLRSLVLSRLRRDEEALAAAREAARLSPEHPFALHRLAICQWTTGDRPAARETAQRLLRVDPEAAYVHVLLAWHAVEERRFGHAEAHARDALKRDPESWEGFNYLGEALAGQERKREAIRAFHDAARLNPTHERVRKNLRYTLTTHLHGGCAVVVILVGALLAIGLTFLPRVGAGFLAALCAAFPALALAAAAWLRMELRKMPPDLVEYYKDAFWRVR